MQVPLKITFRGVDHSDAVEDRIRECASKLELFHERITSCKVTVEAPHRASNKGTLFTIRIDLVVPGAELVVTKSPGDEREHEDIYIAIRDAFDAAKRQLHDYVNRKQKKTRQGGSDGFDAVPSESVDLNADDENQHE